MSPFDSAEFNRGLFFPRRDTSTPPKGASDRFMLVPGARLHLRQYAAIDARLKILLFHGNGEVIADYDEAAEQFAKSGAALAVVDYRSYGQSQGEPTLRNLIEDAPRVVAALGERSVIVMGRSLGSAAAAEIYRDPPPSIVGFIWESGFVDLDAALRRRGILGPRSPDEDEHVFDPIRKLRIGRLPLLVIHGADDELIDPMEAQSAFDAAGTTIKELVRVPGRGHNDLNCSPVYWQTIAAFVQKCSGDIPPREYEQGRNRP